MWHLFIWASLDIYCLRSKSNSSESSKPGLTINYLSHLQHGNCSEKHFDLLSRGINERIFDSRQKPLLYTHIYLKAVPNLLHLSVKQQELPTYNKKNIESAERVLGAKVSPADHPARRVDPSDEAKVCCSAGLMCRWLLCDSAGRKKQRAFPEEIRPNVLICQRLLSLSDSCCSGR